MTWRVFVRLKPSFPDHRGLTLAAEWKVGGGRGLRRLRTGQAYELSGGLDRAGVDRLVRGLLTDPVTQEAVVSIGDGLPSVKGARPACVWPRAGVADPVADTVRMAARDLDVRGLEAVRSGHLFDFYGAVPAAEVKRFCGEHLMNALVQDVEVGG